MLDRKAEEYASKVAIPFMSPDLSKTILDLIAKAYKDGAKATLDEAWRMSSKHSELLTERLDDLFSDVTKKIRTLSNDFTYELYEKMKEE